MASDLVVVGAGGFGRETLDVIEAANRAGATDFAVVGIVDDAPGELNTRRLLQRGYPVLGTVDELVTGGPARRYALAIGSPHARRLVAGRLDAAGWQPVTLVHPDAVLGSIAGLGEGCIICGGVQVSTNVRLGRHVHLNPNATVGHDADLSDFVSVNPAAIVSGEVQVGPETLVGAGATILQNLALGEGVIVGAGSVVTRDVPPHAVVKGIPGRWTS